MASPGSTYSPGSWYALVSPTAAVFVDPTMPGAQLDALWDGVLAGRGVDEALQVIGGGGRRLPSFAVAAAEGSRVRVVVRGAIQITVQDADGLERAISGAGVEPWREDVVDRAETLWFVRPGGGRDGLALPVVTAAVTADILAWQPDAVARHGDAEPRGVANGAVPASSGSSGSNGVVTSPRVVPDTGATASARPMPVPEPADGPVEVVTPPSLEPQPVASEASRATDPTPAAATSAPPREPGAAIPHAIVMAPPPAPPPPPASPPVAAGAPVVPAGPQRLGILFFSTGEAVDVDGPVVIGRAPAQPDGEQARLVAVKGNGRGISRTHVRVAIDGLGVHVMDLGSRNGTVVKSRAGESSTLEPGVQHRLQDGQIVTMADVSFEFRAL